MDRGMGDLALEHWRHARKRQDLMFKIWTDHRASIPSLAQNVGATLQTRGAMRSEIAQIRATQNRHDDGWEHIEDRLGLAGAAPA